MTAYKGLGTYGNAVGVVTPLDHKMSNAAMVVKQAGNLIRAGLFYNGTDTIVTGKANMSYDVAAYPCVTTRGATSGAVFGGNDGVLNVATTAAPGSNSRYDLLYHWHREYSIDGVDSNPVIGVIQGSPAASPTVPSLATFPGAIELARVLVPAGVTATNTGTTITQTAQFTAMAGGRIYFRTTTEMNVATVTLNQKAICGADNSEYVWNGTAWVRTWSPGSRPFAMAAGVATTVNGVTAISLPAGRFTQPPVITLAPEFTGAANQSFYSVVLSKSATSISIYSVKNDGTLITTNHTVHWTAVQMTPTSADG